MCCSYLAICPIFKKKSKICDFLFSSFDLCTGIILKQLNKIKNLNIFLGVFSLFIFLCCFLFFSPLCFPIVVPVVLPRCSPHCGARGTAEATGNCSLSFSTNARALAQNAHPDSLHWDHRPGETPRGDTTGRHNGETKRGHKTGNKMQKWKRKKEKLYL